MQRKREDRQPRTPRSREFALVATFLLLARRRYPPDSVSRLLSTRQAHHLMNPDQYVCTPVLWSIFVPLVVGTRIDQLVCQHASARMTHDRASAPGQLSKGWLLFLGPFCLFLYLRPARWRHGRFMDDSTSRLSMTTACSCIELSYDHMTARQCKLQAKGGPLSQVANTVPGQIKRLRPSVIIF